MVSDLKWRFGFSWGSLLFFLAAGVSSFINHGWVRAAMAVICAFCGLSLLHQYRRWNRAGWPQVHFRAMHAYAAILGRRAAEMMGEEASRLKLVACRDLGLMLCGADKEREVDAMLEALVMERGTYLSRLLSLHIDEVQPDASPALAWGIAQEVATLEFGPQLVIANVIENSFGGAEAARYAVALLAGEAS